MVRVCFGTGLGLCRTCPVATRGDLGVFGDVISESVGDIVLEMDEDIKADGEVRMDGDVLVVVELDLSVATVGVVAVVLTVGVLRLFCP